ncbi:peroxidase family protein [Gemmobacter nectariphilus]|uniref:peroxidase family protein n=1 Tax=Gemmobacter nectariphilus TaxID=220343 RepID=UPI0003F60FC3|nr:peroxidase family protein [Gemmobacter nectariphilus]
MRHGQGFDLVFQEWLRIAAQPAPDRAEPAPGFDRYEPMFDYQPSELLDDPASGVALPDLLAMLARLATQMHVGALKVAGSVGRVPAGYTYLGQFAIHDLVNTASFRTTLDRNLPRRQFGSIQSAALDLASLYGGGPAGSPAFFEPTDETEHRARFRLGWMRDSSGDPARLGQPTRQEDIPRLALGPDVGAAPGDKRFDPLLADTRNADNLMISQLVVLMMKTHNRLYDAAHRLAADGRAHSRLFARPFEAARCILTAIYHRILREDFLPRILPDAALPVLDTPAPAAGVRLEAALAVLRFGHAMVQPVYDFSAVHSAGGPSGQARLERLMDFFGMHPTRDLPADDTWVIDWSMFLDPLPGADRPVRMNRARPFGPTIAEPLRTHAATRIAPPAELPALAGHRLGLGWRTMAKGVMARLPTGQALARRLVQAGRINAGDVVPTDALERMLRAGRTAGCIGERCLTEADIAFLAQRSPLFFYILAEARHFTDGDKLGPVGGLIVAETFASGLVDPGFGGEVSLRTAATALWQELYPSGPAMPATMAELVAFAAG